MHVLYFLFCIEAHRTAWLCIVHYILGSIYQHCSLWFLVVRFSSCLPYYNISTGWCFEVKALWFVWDRHNRWGECAITLAWVILLSVYQELKVLYSLLSFNGTFCENSNSVSILLLFFFYPTGLVFHWTCLEKLFWVLSSCGSYTSQPNDTHS